MTRRDRVLVAGVALLGVLAAFWFLALQPQREEARVAGEQLAAAQARLTEARTLQRGLEAARANLPAAQAALAELGKAVPADDDTASLVYQLSRAARRARIDFRAFALAPGGGGASATTPSEAAPASEPAPPGTQAVRGGLRELPLTFTFDGGYFALQRLLELVHGFTAVDGDDVRVRGRLVAVQSVAISRGRAGFPDVQATITAKAYLATDDVALPAAPEVPAPPAAPATTAEPTQAAGTPTPPAAAISGATR